MTSLSLLPTVEFVSQPAAPSAASRLLMRLDPIGEQFTATGAQLPSGRPDRATVKTQLLRAMRS
jgi:hypothetical protein